MGYISLGFHEKDDIGIIVDFIETIQGVGILEFGVDTAMALLYAHKDPRIKAICLDWPFADFRKLVGELASNNFNYPNFLVDTILNFFGKKIKKKMD